MIKTRLFEITKIADDFLAIPVGEKAKSFNGVVALNAASAFLLSSIQEEDKDEDELVELLASEYDVSIDVARKDVRTFIQKMKGLGMIE